MRGILKGGASMLVGYERSVIRERTHAGLNAARARGRNGGRPRKLSRKGVELAVTMLGDPHNRIDDICTMVGISRWTLYHYAKAVKRATT
jgi:DNA invertase Pin-like site-specific DNA recombinase